MTAENLKNWLKTKLGDTRIAVGGIDGNADRYIGVYDGKRAGAHRMCVGGRKNTKYREAPFDILVHWTTSATDAAAKAQEIYDLFDGLPRTDMDGVPVISADPGGRPEWAGREGRICEYLIRLKLTYERTDNNG